MSTLYACLGSGNCFKPWLAAQQLGRPVELALIDVLKGEQKSPAFLAINPLGVVPYLQLQPGQGLGESNAMAWYLCEQSHLMPQTARERAEALQWMFFEQSRLEPFISPARFCTTILPQPDRAAEIAQWQSRAQPGLARLDAHLSQRQFILESGYSVADIAVFGYVHLIEEAGLSLSAVPSVARWVDAVCQTDGFRPISDMGTQLLAAA